MAKQRRLSALMSKVAVIDPDYKFMGILRHINGVSLRVSLSNLNAFISLREDVDLKIVHKYSNYDTGSYSLEWDVTGIEFIKKEVTPYKFDGRDDAKRNRKASIEQEEEGALLIGGRRHAGSGAMSWLKSDASSERWQMEAKHTGGKSIRVTLDWLSQISIEAREQDKWPIVYIKFSDVPGGMVASDKWVIIPVDVFKLCRW